MSSFQCSICGGNLKYKPAVGYVCEKCRNKYDGPEIKDSFIDKLNFANAKRIEDYDFEGSLRECQLILDQAADNQEANWCALLAENQIAYVKDKKDKYTATFMNPEIGSLKKSKYYEKLNTTYLAMADQIEEERLNVIKESSLIPFYNVFISYKSGGVDEALAEMLYNELSKNKNYQIFFAKKCLGQYSEEWEPHIYNALKSANVLILLGSTPANIHSEWVANEWKRFLAYKNMGEPKMLILAVGQNVIPEQLPGKLPKLQALKILPFAANEQDNEWIKVLVEKTDKAIGSLKNVDSMKEKANMLICKKRFHHARRIYKNILDSQPKSATSYWGLLKCRLKAFDDYDIVVKKKEIEKYKEYQDAIHCATGELKKEYEAVNIACIKRNKEAYKDKRINYEYYMKHSKVQRFFKKVAIVCFILLFGAFGVYSYYGITEPLHYQIQNGKAVLNGRSLYADFVIRDLNIDTYGNYPVVEIADGVFKNSRIETLTISDSVKTIGKNAFSDCSKLTSVVSSYSNLTIGDQAFANCTALEKVSIEHCAYLGEQAFDACINLKEIKIGITDETVIEQNAFANLDEQVIIYVPSIAETLTMQLRTEYPSLYFQTYTQDKIEECIYFIDQLQEISFSSEENIKRAERIYNSLSESEKMQIYNYGILQNAKASYEAIRAIHSIDLITLESEKAIIEAENIYNTLTEEQKQLVQNYEYLLTARAVFDTMVLIENIGEVQITSEPKIVKAEEAYLALSYEQRDLVANYSKLTTARTKVDILLVGAVMLEIEKIDTIINLESETQILMAEAAYNSLSENQQKRVSNYDTLISARAIYNVIKAIDNIGIVTTQSGSTITIAQNLYTNLTSAQKLKVINYNELTDAVAVYPVVVQIAAIGNVMPNSLGVIEKAEVAYANLGVVQQTKVSNYEILVNSRIVYATVSLIDEIGTISENSGLKIQNALVSYEQLTSEQKSIVGNYNILSEASAIYETIVLIQSIGDVSLNSLSVIQEAERHYNSLNLSQKEKISNYQTLLFSRAIYNVMTIVELQESVWLGKGTNYSYQFLSTSNMESLLNDRSFCAAIESITLTGLSSFRDESYWKEAFPKLNLVRYDVTGGTTLKSFVFTPSDLSYRIVGALQTHDIFFTASFGDKLNIEFDNFSFVSPGTAMNFTMISNVNITFIGTCSIESGNSHDVIDAKNIAISLQEMAKVTLSAGDGTENNPGGIGISATKIELKGTASSNTTSLTITGGNGSAGDVGFSGGNGGSGLKATNVVADATYAVKIIGGNGGIAGSCVNSYSSTATGATVARSGSNGFAGGTGGDAITAYSLNITSSITLECTGGNGGNGSAGGNGENSDCNGNPKAGNGGDGGAGGNGGSAIYLLGSISTSSTASIRLLAGIGGNGGSGGKAGKGLDVNRRDDGGDGGSGGAGGNSGYCLVASISTISNSLTVIAANGGNGGVGGEGGYAAADASITPKCGAGGNGGNGGDSCISAGVNTSLLKITYAVGGNGGNGGSAGSTSYSAWLKKAVAGRSGNGGNGGNIILGGNIYKTGEAGTAGSTNRINTYTGAPGGNGGAGAKIN